MMKVIQNLIFIIVGFLLGLSYKDFFSDDKLVSEKKSDRQVLKQPEIAHQQKKQLLQPKEILSAKKKNLSKQDADFTLLLAYIDKGSYLKAKQLFFKIEREKTNVIKENKNDLMDKLYVWLNTKHNQEDLIVCLRKLDDLFYNHVDVILLLARSYANNDNWFSAIKESYRVKDLTNSVTLLKEVDKEIRLYVARAFESLMKLGRYQLLKQILEYVLEFSPDDPFYRLDYALLLSEMGNFKDAIQIAVSLSDHEEAGKKAEKILKKIRYHKIFQESKENSIKVPIEVEHNHFVVTVLINETTKVRLLIDTGASYTSIKESVFFDIIGGWSSNLQTINVQTASDVVTSYIHQVDSVSLGKAIVHNIQIASLKDLDIGHYDGLLGMNFLDYFIFQFDKENKYLILRRKKK